MVGEKKLSFAVSEKKGQNDSQATVFSNDLSFPILAPKSPASDCHLILMQLQTFYWDFGEAT